MYRRENLAAAQNACEACAAAGESHLLSIIRQLIVQVDTSKKER